MPTAHTLTSNAFVGDFEKLFIATRIGENRRRHRYTTGGLSSADSVQVELDVDVTEPAEGHVTPQGHFRVVSTVADRVEDNNVSVRTGEVENSVETGEALERDAQTSCSNSK